MKDGRAPMTHPQAPAKWTVSQTAVIVHPSRPISHQTTPGEAVQVMHKSCKRRAEKPGIQSRHPNACRASSPSCGGASVRSLRKSFGVMQAQE